MISIDQSGVSAVIPTHKRPEMVLRAVQSVLNQTYTILEIIVVIDGADEATEATLRTISDQRVRVISLANNVGASMARNIGVRASHGKWVAFLDDDDEWFPDKIAKQVAVAAKSRFRYPIVSCQVVAHTGTGDVIWPRKMPTRPLCEYLLARNALSYGEGVMNTTTLFAPRELFGCCEFKSSVEPLEDWDWLLRCDRQRGVGIEFLTEPLALWNVPPNRISLSSRSNWRSSIEWLREIKEDITPRAYAGFIAGTVALHASEQKEWRAFFPLLREMRQSGAPQPSDYILYFGRCIPKTLRRRVARLIEHLPRPAHPFARRSLNHS